MGDWILEREKNFHYLRKSAGRPASSSCQFDTLIHSIQSMKLKSTTILRAAFAAFFITAAAPVGAQVITTLTPPAPPAGQTPRFGSKTVAGERFILIADTGDDELGADAGAVYVHNAVTGAFLRKLKATDGAAGDQFGSSVALSNEFAIIGAAQDDDRGTDSGSAYVFNVSTGLQVRKLNAADGVTLDKFGSAAALQGDIGIIGAADSAAKRGAVYVFNISSNQQLRKLTANGGVAEDRFGSSVALSGNLGLIGANGVNARAGAAYIFDVSSGAFLKKLTAEDGEAEDAFSGSVALSGNLAVIGASRDDDKGSNAGAAYLFSVRSGKQLRKLHASDGDSLDQFGSAIAIQENMIVVGAPLKSGFRGQVYVFDAITGSELRKLAPVGLRALDLFGSNVSAYASRIVVGVPQTSSEKGFVLAFSDQSVPAPASVIAQSGTNAPGLVNTLFTGFTAHTLNGQGESILQAGLNTPVASNAGAWNRLSPTLDLMIQKSQTINGRQVSAIQAQIMNDNSAAVAKVQLTGAGVTTANDIELIADNGSNIFSLMRESVAITGGGFSGQIIREIKEVSASHSLPQAAVFTTFAAPAPATADSGIAILDLRSGSVLGGLREGDAAPFEGTTIGTIEPRIAFTNGRAIACVSLVGAPVASNAALLQFHPGSLVSNLPNSDPNAPALRLEPGQPTTAIARKGDIAPGTNGSTFTAFRAESVSSIDEPVFLADITGPANVNQGIWTRQSGSNSVTLVLQKGSQLPGLAGVTFSSFTRFWALGFGRVLVQAKLTGTGVGTTNDDILFYVQGSRKVILIREGDVAPGCDGARIGGFQKVDADPDGNHYTVQTALVGANAAQNTALNAANQALWLGSAQPFQIEFDANGRPRQVATPDELLRPTLALRKGSLHTLANITARVTSAEIQPPLDTTLAGGRGLGAVVSGSRAAVVLRYGTNVFFAAQTTSATQP